MAGTGQAGKGQAGKTLAHAIVLGSIAVNKGQRVIAQATKILTDTPTFDPINFKPPTDDFINKVIEEADYPEGALQETGDSNDLADGSKFEGVVEKVVNLDVFTPTHISSGGKSRKNRKGKENKTKRKKGKKRRTRHRKH